MKEIAIGVRYYLNSVVLLSISVYILILLVDMKRLSRNAMTFIKEVVLYSQFAIFLSVLYIGKVIFFNDLNFKNIFFKMTILIALSAFGAVLIYVMIHFIYKNLEIKSYVILAILVSLPILTSFMFDHSNKELVYYVIMAFFIMVQFMFFIKTYKSKSIDKPYGSYFMLCSSFSMAVIHILLFNRFERFLLSIDTCLAVFSVLGLFLFFTKYSYDQIVGYSDSLEKKNDKIESIYYKDDVSGCDNFRAFEKDMKDLKKNTYVMVMNIKNFMTYNNLVGYHQGDVVLKETAALIRNIIPTHYKIYRQYSDKFLVIFENASKEEVYYYIKKCDTGFMYSQVSGYQVSVYFGLKHISKDELVDERFIAKTVKDLEIASNMAKEASQLTYEITDVDVAKYDEKYTIETGLRKAVENEEFIVYYQPQIEADSKKIISLEALVRWQKGDKLISPGLFIPIAEENGHITGITKQVVKQVFMDMAHEPSFDGLSVSINISPVHLLEGEFYEYMEMMLASYRINPRLVILELTENVLINDTEQVVNSINKLKSLGFQFSLDDFGTGYSSLHRFMTLEFDEIKFDKCFMDELTESHDSVNSFMRMIKFFKSFDMRVVVEGLETVDQLNILESMPIDIYQGFYYAKPMPIEQLRQELFDKES